MSMESEPIPVLQKPPGYRDPSTTPPPLPPRKRVLPPSFQPKRRRRGFCGTCFCTCCVIILVIIFATIIAAALIYAFFDPSLPEFHLASFRVPKLNVTENSDGAFLNADTAARVEVKNRNRDMVWNFEDITVAVTADNGDLSLGSTKVRGGLEVKENKVASLKVETSVGKVALRERQKKRVKSMFQSGGLVPFVEVRSRTAVRTQGWSSASVGITLECGGVTMRQLDNGNAPLCSVTLLKWIKIG